MVHTGQLFSTEWNDWLHHNCPRQESSLTKDLPGEKETCILHDRLNLENEWILKKKWIKCMDAFPKKTISLSAHSVHPAAAKLISRCSINCKGDIITSPLTYGATIVQLYTLDFFNVSFNIYFLNTTVDSLVTEWGWMWLWGGSVKSPKKQTAIISDTMLWNLQLTAFMFSYLSCPIVLIASPPHYLKLHICKESQSLCNHLSVSCKESTRSNYWFFLFYLMCHSVYV